VVQPRRDVGEIDERRKVRADSLLAALRVRTEMAEPARVRRNPDRRHAIVGSERMTAEYAGRFLVDGCGLLLVAHCTSSMFLATLEHQPAGRRITVSRSRTSTG